MKVKFKNKLEYKIAGIIWFIAGFINFQIYRMGDSRIYLLITLLNLIVGTLSLMINKINYLTLDNEKIIIRRNLLVKRKIMIENIKDIEIDNKSIKLHLKNRRKVKIKHELLSNEDFLKLEEELNKLT